MKIIYDDVNLKNSGMQIVKYSEDFVANIGEIKAQLEALNKVWSGQGATTYSDKFKSFCEKNLASLAGELKNYGQNIETTSEIYESHDEKYKNETIGI